MARGGKKPNRPKNPAAGKRGNQPIPSPAPRPQATQDVAHPALGDSGFEQTPPVASGAITVSEPGGASHDVLVVPQSPVGDGLAADASVIVSSPVQSLQGIVGFNAVKPGGVLEITLGGGLELAATPGAAEFGAGTSFAELPTLVAATPISSVEVIEPTATEQTTAAPSAAGTEVDAPTGADMQWFAWESTGSGHMSQPRPDGMLVDNGAGHVGELRIDEPGLEMADQPLLAPEHPPETPELPADIPLPNLRPPLAADQSKIKAQKRAADTEPGINSELPLLFEIAWEVCWQLGGIYTVLRTKAATMMTRWETRYCLIGPYNPHTAALEFEERPATGYMKEAMDRLKQAGIGSYFGQWLVAGHPAVLLIDYRDRFSSLESDSYLLWKDHGIATNHADGEVNEVVAFGFAVTEFFRALRQVLPDRPVLAHFHEWMGGVAVPRIAHLRLPISTVFTTHATLLGRYLASDNSNFYDHLPFLDGDKEAARYQILPRHLIEKAAAHASTVFTTVSEVTSVEAEQLLGRRPDAILPNGLNIQRFAALHEFQNLHLRYKERISRFVMGHFFPAYTFDLDRTLYFFTSGRYEYRNKGMDFFIETMFRLSQRLRQEEDPPTVVAFIITKAATRHINVGALQSQAMFDDLRHTCENLQEQMGRTLYLAAAKGQLPDGDDLISEDAKVRLKRGIHAWRTGQPPLIVTHDLVNDADDPVLMHLRHRQLFNLSGDPVKVVFHPQFMTATSPLVGLDYEDFVRGCHLGIFPSYYEPWGYTPMECVALGVPSVTTDLSGFGAYVRHHVPESRKSGICVLDRRQHGFEQTCNEMVDYLVEFCHYHRRQRIELRNRTERLSELFDWSVMIKHYEHAHRLALQRIGSTLPGKVSVRVI